MEVINLNLIPNGTNPVVHVSQYDEGRDFRFNLFDGTSVLNLDGTETIECDVKKPDGNIVTVAVTNTSSNYLVVTTTLQMTACGGNSLGTIKISKGGNNLYTLNFILYCERNPLEGGITSDSGIHNLETQVISIVSDQYDAADVIFDNVPTSGHIAPYTVDSDGLYSYIPKELHSLDDVDISSPTSGEAVVWDGTKWTNGTVSTVGSIDDLNDVDTTGKADGDSLRYDANASEWIAQPTTVALTQAEYDALALSGDLVPNTHYVITDAQNLNPTASDIEYSSGVSVKQAIDSKQATLTTTATTDTAYGQLQGGGYVVLGNIVYVDLIVKILQSTGYGYYIQRGLPSPQVNSIQIIGNRADDWDYSNNAVLYGFRIDSTGSVYHNGNTPLEANKVIHIFGSYVKA